ncbi:hypothetical protein HAX54_000947 [Datura stramonium]|uniref:Uncharacterized protein n=1 Tax=Datura stramonium TaxID=4076 RepID=A0ABS8T2U1_DATST|nr:hypothetical protein [Datura stramonium]
MGFPKPNTVKEKVVPESSGEHLYEGNLTDIREGQLNILQSEAKIIKGFVDAKVRQGGGLLEQTTLPPSKTGSHAHHSSPKWDGTPISRCRCFLPTISDAGDTSLIKDEVRIVGKESQRERHQIQMARGVATVKNKKGHGGDDQGLKEEVGLSHLFKLPMPMMYKLEVITFYEHMMFTEDRDAIFASVNGVDFIVDVANVGQILRVLMDRIHTIKDKMAYRDLMELIGNLQSNRMFKK